MLPSNAGDASLIVLASRASQHFGRFGSTAGGMQPTCSTVRPRVIVVSNRGINWESPPALAIARLHQTGTTAMQMTARRRVLRRGLLLHPYKRCLGGVRRRRWGGHRCFVRRTRTT